MTLITFDTFWELDESAMPGVPDSDNGGKRNFRQMVEEMVWWDEVMESLDIVGAGNEERLSEDDENRSLPGSFDTAFDQEVCEQECGGEIVHDRCIKLDIFDFVSIGIRGAFHFMKVLAELLRDE